MKLISWLFSATRRHFREVNKYERGGKGRRIFTILLTLLLVGASAGLQYWFCYTLASISSETPVENAGIISIISGILAVAVTAYTLDFSATFSYVGFKTAILGYAISASLRKSKEKKSDDSSETQDGVENEPTFSKHKGLDILVGILELIFAVAVIVIAIFIIKTTFSI